MRWIWGVAAAVAMTGWGESAMAQDAPPGGSGGEAATEVMEPATPAVPQWRVFSRSGYSNYLIDLSSVATEGEERRVTVARVPSTAEAGGYGHVVDTFGIRCSAAQTQVALSTDVLDDGVASEPYETGEPWSDVRAGSLDEVIKDLVCDDLVPSGEAYATIRDYIDAGRP